MTYASAQREKALIILVRFVFESAIVLSPPADYNYVVPFFTGSTSGVFIIVPCANIVPVPSLFVNLPYSSNTLICESVFIGEPNG